ncbi:MAG: COG4315 family predicted lipoprotein [Gaiellales bacterium]
MHFRRLAGISRGWRIGIAAALAAVLAAGVALAATHSSSSAGAVSVRIASNAHLHRTVLVDSHGMTLYHLTAEHRGHVICDNQACLSLWTPLTVRSGAQPSGVAGLGTMRRPDGALQVTYRGEPLYTFRQDSAPGDARGNGFRDVGVWLAATTGAAAGAQSAPPPAPTGGYGY